MDRLFKRLIVALLLAVVVYGAFVAWTGYVTLKAALSHFAWWTFFCALGLSSFNYGLRFLKWQFYLARLKIQGVPAFDSFLIFLSGFVLTVTPGKVGEVFKSAVLEKTYGVELAKTAPIVIAERLTDVIAIVVLVVIGSLGFSGGLYWAIAGSIAVCLGLMVILWPPMLRGVVAWFERGGPRRRGLAPKVQTAVISLQVVATPRALVWPTLLSLVGWGAEGSALYLLLKGFGMAASLELSLFFYATATLAGALVPVPGGLGVAEGLMQSQLVEIGKISAGAATGSMLMIRFATLWWAVIVGFVALTWLRFRHPELTASKAGVVTSQVVHEET